MYIAVADYVIAHATQNPKRKSNNMSESTTIEEESNMEEIQEPYSGEEEATREVAEEQDGLQEQATLTLDDLPRAGPNKLKLLREAGYDTLAKLARAKLSDLTEIPGIAERGAIDAIAFAQEATGIGATVTGAEWLTSVGKADYIDLTFDGNGELNTLVGGGAEIGKITQFYGHEGSGKSQILFQAIANTIAPKHRGGRGGRVLYIDAENTSTAALRGDSNTEGRVTQMLRAKGCTDEEIQEAYSERLELARVSNSEMQIVAPTRAIANDKEYDLLALDGLMTKLSVEMVGRGKLAERQGILGEHLNDLEAFGDIKNAAVLITNQVHDKPDAMYGDPVHYKGGHIAGHNSKYIVKLRKAAIAQSGPLKGTRKFVARCVKAAGQAEMEAVYAVTAEGIIDG